MILNVPVMVAICLLLISFVTIFYYGVNSLNLLLQKVYSLPRLELFESSGGALTIYQCDT